MIGRYRIYPAWFAGDSWSGNAPMQELADREARRLGLFVAGIAITAEDHDHRGRYLDFEVLYTSSGVLKEESS